MNLVCFFVLFFFFDYCRIFPEERPGTRFNWALCSISFEQFYSNGIYLQFVIYCKSFDLLIENIQVNKYENIWWTFSNLMRYSLRTEGVIFIVAIALHRNAFLRNTTNQLRMKKNNSYNSSNFLSKTIHKYLYNQYTHIKHTQTHTHKQTH